MTEEQAREHLSQYKSDKNHFDNLSKDEIKYVQKYLMEKGFDLSNYGADGVIGEETLSAIDSYGSAAEQVPEILEEGINQDRNEGESQEDYISRRISEKQSRDAEIQNQENIDKQFQRDRGIASRDAYNITQGAVDLGRLASSINQIKQGKRQRNDAERPEYTPRPVSPELKNQYYTALKDSQKGFTDSERSAMDESNLYAHANSLRSVAALGSGQAGISASGAQALHGKNLKNNLNSAIANAQARQSNQAFATDAARSLAADKNDIYRMGMQYNYLPKLQEYRRSLGEASALERQGRVNLDNLASLAPYRAVNMVRDNYGRGRELDNFHSSVSNRGSQVYPHPSDVSEPVNSYDPRVEPYNPSLGFDENEYLV